MNANDTPMRPTYPVPDNLPKYKSHKVVQAAKIVMTQGTLLTCVSPPPGEGLNEYRFDVSHQYFEKHKPEIGGYFVMYEGGYQSYSPAEPFESGYTRID